jgi:phosphatidylglycerol---prolipoprotein diacylglyceryl transferase
LHPILFKFGSFTLYTFGLMAALGFFAGIYYTKYEAGREGYDPETAVDMTFWLMIMGLAGSRLMFIITEYDFYLGKPLEMLKIWNGGLVWYGGLIGGIITAYVFCRIKGLKFMDMADLLAPAAMLGLCIGRIGCLSAGCDYGRVVESGPHWWTLRFSDLNSIVPNELLGYPLFPSQPLMSLNALAIFLFLAWLIRRKSFSGQIFFAMLAIYYFNRFLIEFVRGDENRGFVVPGLISTSQFVSLLVFPAALGALIYLYRRKVKNV